jgi:hypothetical protein
LELGLRAKASILADERIFVADAHRDDGKRFVADEKLTAFVELESAIRAGSELA